MKYAIIIDSVAAVPSYFLEQRPFAVMPVSVEVDGKVVPDSFSDEELIEFYTSGSLKVKSKVSSSPPTKEQISELITEEIAPKYDYAFCLPISRQTSPTYDNFQAAANGISKLAREKRDKLGIEHSFHMNCVNSGSTISGCGLIAIYADMILNRGISYNDYASAIQKFTRVVHNYGVVTDVLYSRARAQEKGIKSLSLPAALIGKTVGLNPIVQISYDHITKPVSMKRGIDASIDSLFNYAVEQIKNGLFAPIINISYAGDPVDLNRYESYATLVNTSKENKVKVLIGVMSLAAGVIFGPGAVTLGIAPKDQSALPN